MKIQKLHTTKKTGFKVPKDYFYGLEDSIINQAKLSEIIKSSGFKTPPVYFDSLEDKILAKTKQEPKLIYLFTKQNLMYAASIAAVLILMLNVFWYNSNSTSTIELAEIELYLLQQDISEYELASLLTENDLITNNFIDSYISEESIEAYLLENATIEDLISE